MNRGYLRSVLLAVLWLTSVRAFANNVSGDFNGDGFADLAVGVPGEDQGAGAVNVTYGSAFGLLPEGGIGIPASQFWVQGSPGISGASEKGDQFGSALAAGDFNDDGFSDLAIGIPGEVGVSSGVGFSGRVMVIYGSSRGLTTPGRRGSGGASIDSRRCPARP